jgi:hypothetical protein
VSFIFHLNGAGNRDQTRSDEPIPETGALMPAAQAMNAGLVGSTRTGCRGGLDTLCLVPFLDVGSARGTVLFI